VKLTRKEFGVLDALTGYAGEVVPRKVLLALVWGYSPDGAHLYARCAYSAIA
jgi:DNA-binding response OmpR family regulator